MIIYTNLFALSREFVPLSAFLIQEFQLPLLIAPCSYCYLPEEMRRDGKTMSAEELCDALTRLRDYFQATLPGKVRPQLIFHGSEPLLAKEVLFVGIERFDKDFVFGLQTNASLLDDDDIGFLRDHQVGIGISLDAPKAETANLALCRISAWRGCSVQ